MGQGFLIPADRTTSTTATSFPQVQLLSETLGERSCSFQSRIHSNPTQTGVSYTTQKFILNPCPSNLSDTSTQMASLTTTQSTPPAIRSDMADGASVQYPTMPSILTPFNVDQYMCRGALRRKHPLDYYCADIGHSGR